VFGKNTFVPFVSPCRTKKASIADAFLYLNLFLNLGELFYVRGIFLSFVGSLLCFSAPFNNFVQIDDDVAEDGRLLEYRLGCGGKFFGVGG